MQKRDAHPPCPLDMSSRAACVPTRRERANVTLTSSHICKRLILALPKFTVFDGSSEAESECLLRCQDKPRYRYHTIVSKLLNVLSRCDQIAPWSRDPGGTIGSSFHTLLSSLACVEVDLDAALIADSPWHFYKYACIYIQMHLYECVGACRYTRCRRYIMSTVMNGLREVKRRRSFHGRQLEVGLVEHGPVKIRTGWIQDSSNAPLLTPSDFVGNHGWVTDDGVPDHLSHRSELNSQILHIK